MAISKKLIATGGLSLLLLTLLAGTTVYLFMQNNNRNSLGLSDREILAKIAENNPQNINRPSNANTLMAESDSKIAAGGVADLSIIGPAYDFKYTYSKTIFEDGNASTKCEQNYSYPGSEIYRNTVSEYYSYFDGNAYYSKNITTNPDGELISYNLSNTRESYTYAGGEYAVRFTYPENPVMAEPAVLKENIGNTAEAIDPIDPTVTNSEEEVIVEPEITEIIEEQEPEEQVTPEEPVEQQKPDIDEVIRNMFGENVDVDIVEENGEDVILVTSRHNEGNCMIAFDSTISSDLRMEATDNSQGDEIVILNYVDVNSFQIERSERYVNSVGESNLLDKIQTTVENSNADFDEVSENFEFDYDVEVRTKAYDPNEYIIQMEKFGNTLRNYITTNPTVFVLPVNSENIRLNSINLPIVEREISENDPFNSYYRDRDFYADTDLGEALYESMVEMQEQAYNSEDYIQSDVEIGLSSTNQNNEIYTNISIFRNRTDIEDIKEQTIGHAYTEVAYGKYNVVENDIELNINGNNVSATVYEINYEEGVTDTLKSDTAELTLMPYSSTYYRIMFSYNGNLYSINVQKQNYSATEPANQKLTNAELSQFTTLTNNINVIRPLVNNYIQNNTAQVEPITLETR